MHIGISIVIIFFIWYRGIWRNWKQYHATMLFFGFMELLYNLIVGTNNYFLWKIMPDLYLTRITTISLYVFIIFPGTALLYLSGFPQDKKKQIIHIIKWVTIYIVVEWIASLSHRIIYLHGWSIWHSFVFDIMLFLGLILHYRKPIIAYIVFIAVTVLGILGYKIPI